MKKIKVKDPPAIIIHSEDEILGEAAELKALRLYQEYLKIFNIRQDALGDVKGFFVYFNGSFYSYFERGGILNLKKIFEELGVAEQAMATEF